MDLVWLLAAYARFGPIVSAGPLGGIVSNRAAVYEPRQRWLDREAEARGLDREGIEMIFDAIDLHIERAARRAAKEEAD